MKKLVGAAVVVLIVTVAGMPVVVGTVTESRMMGQVEAFSDNEFVAVRVRDYARGWRTSSAKIDLELSELYRDRIRQILIQDQNQRISVPDVEDMLARTVTLAVDVAHGPIVVNNGVHMGLASSVIRLDPETEGLDKLLAKLGVPYLFEIRTRSGFSTVSEFEVEVPSMAFEDPNSSVNFSGFSADGTYDFENRHVVTEGRTENIEIDSELTTLTARNFTVRGDYRMVSTYVWEGPIELAVETMTLLNASPNGPPYLEASKVGFTAATRMDETRGTLDMHASYHVDSIQGDDITLTDARFDMNMRNLDITAIESYNRITQDLMFEPENALMLLPELEDTFFSLLVAEPTVDLGPMYFTWNGDAFEAVLRIQADNEMLPPQAAFSLMDMGLWTRLFDVRAELDVAQGMAEWIAIQASKYQLRNAMEATGEPIDAEELDALAESQGPGMLLLLVAQGMIEVTGTGYRSELNYENGVLEVNGRAIPIGPQF